MELQVGMEFKGEVKVTNELLAKSVGSGEVSVFATPMMIALIEKTASEGVKPYLEEGSTTVGTLVNVSHDAPTPEGMTATAVCKVKEIDGRRIAFDVVCYDDKTEIGKGTHERFIVKLDKFNQKAMSKAE